MSAQISYREHNARERYSPAFGGTVERLPEGWVCGLNCDIGGEPGRPVRIDLVLMHPTLGIALVDRKTAQSSAVTCPSSTAPSSQTNCHRSRRLNGLSVT